MLLRREPELDRDTEAERLHAEMVAGAGSAARCARQAVRLLEREPAAVAYPHGSVPLLVDTLIAADSLAEVRLWLAVALERASRLNLKAALKAVYAEQALVLLAAGNLAQARLSAERALRLTGADLPAEAMAEASARAATALALVAVESGDTQLSTRVLAMVRGKTDDLQLTAALHLLRGCVAAGRHDLRLALANFNHCGRQLTRVGWLHATQFPWQSWALMLHHRLGETRTAHEMLAKEWDWAQSWGAPAAIGRTLRLRGALTEGRRGLMLLYKAVETLRGSGNQAELAKTVVLLGERLRSVDESVAHKHLNQGYQLAIGCGALRLAERASGPWCGPVPPETGPTLTKGEHRVAAMAVRGSTNQQIANTLGVTCRAVEKHLTSTYRKLGVSGRPELAEALPQLAGDPLVGARI